MATQCKYSCRTASETLEWIQAIADFIKPYSFFWEAHVVNFYKDRLWEAVDKDWIDCLRTESVDHLLHMPSGVVQDHWPASLKEFIVTLKALSIPREQADLTKIFPDLHVTLLSSVLSQGMNQKKKHEIEALAPIVNSVARAVGANTIIDVGAGQGYLTQVLSYEYQLSVIAMDECSRHGRITNRRAERIKKHYSAKMRKTCLEEKTLTMPKTVTCRVLSPDTLKAFVKADETMQPSLIAEGIGSVECSYEDFLTGKVSPPSDTDCSSSLILTGLHACGDLSVTILRTFVECKEVKAVVSIGCCYNLLSEEEIEKADSICGFPVSEGVKATHQLLGKSARDLASQVISKYFPETLTRSPMIGRQGKALHRRHQRASRQDTLFNEEATGDFHRGTDVLFDILSGTSENTKIVNKRLHFEKFCQAGLSRLNLLNIHGIDFAGIWEESEPFAELIGPYWSLRASIGPVLETLLLLDRLLFLQEQENSVDVVMVPAFNPAVSPRNVALIAKKAVKS